MLQNELGLQLNSVFTEDILYARHQVPAVIEFIFLQMCPCVCLCVCYRGKQINRKLSNGDKAYD